MTELHTAFGRCFADEQVPKFRFVEWSDIPDELVREDWLSPNLFEELDALAEIDDEDRENFLRWCRQNGYDIATDDVAEFAARYLSIFGVYSEPDEEPPDAEDLLCAPDYRSDRRRYSTDMFEENLN